MSQEELRVLIQKAKASLALIHAIRGFVNKDLLNP